jgi:hypothetical protein
MTFRKLDATGDWTFGQGLSNYAQDESAVDLNIQTRLLSWVGDCFFDLQAGIDWKHRLDMGQAQILVDEIKSNLIAAYGVVAVLSVSSNLDRVTRRLSVSYNIQTFFSPSFQQTIIQTAGAVGA